MLIEVFVDTRVAENITRGRQCCRIGANSLTQWTLSWMWRELDTMLGRLSTITKMMSTVEPCLLKLSSLPPTTKVMSTSEPH